MSKCRSGAIVALGVSFTAGAAHATTLVYRPTNYGNGADAEVRESNPTQNRGASTEIASRIKNEFPAGDASDGTDRNSVIYLQFDLTNLGNVTTTNSKLRLTYRNNNLNETRIGDADGMLPDFGAAGMVYYGIPGTAFNEATITYNTAPGITPDGNVGTVDLNANAMFLGQRDFPAIGTQNWLPVGGAFDFGSASLDAFLANELATNPSGVAVIAVMRRHTGDFDKAPSAWLNFNYLFNPKEQTTLNSDPSYDTDITDPNNPTGSPWSGADNSAGLYSPQLVLIPSPGAGAIALLGLPVVLRRRRH